MIIEKVERIRRDVPDDANCISCAESNWTCNYCIFYQRAILGKKPCCECLEARKVAKLKERK